MSAWLCLPRLGTDGGPVGVRIGFEQIVLGGGYGG